MADTATPTKLDGMLADVRGTEEEKKLLSYLNQSFSTAQSNRLQYEKQWYLNIAFFFGRHYVQWTNELLNSPMIRMYEPVAPPWRVRLVSNQMQRYARKEIAKITSENPTGYVLPASTDESDLMAARAGEAIIEHEWRELKIKRELRRAVWWQVITGTGFVKDWYNDFTQEAVVEMITPFNIWVPDTLQEEIERQPFVIHGASKDPDWVQSRYGVKPPAEGKYSEGGFEDKFLSAMGLHQADPKSVCFVKEAWFKPGGKFPNGAVFIWCGDMMLHKGDQWPFLHDEYPFTKLEHIPTGRFYAEAAITSAIPLQKEYNKSRSMIHEAKNRTAMPRTWAPIGSVNVKKITSEPGLIIEYKPGFEKPQTETPPSIPSYMLNELDRIRQDMDDIFSQHETSRGQTPPNVEAATAISFLQEQDDTSLANSVASVEEGCEKIGRHLLGYVNLYWDQPRLIRVVGYSKQFEAFEFSKESLNGTTNYHVQAGSAQPRSLAAKQAFLFEIADRQLVPPDRILKYLEMADSGALYEEIQTDFRHAQRENLMFKNGMEVMVNEWDNHTSHIIEHDNFCKRQEFMMLDPQIQAGIREHVRQHKTLLIIQNGYPPPQMELNPTTGQPQPNALMLDSMAYRIMMGIPIQEFAPVGALMGAQQSSPNGANQIQR